MQVKELKNEGLNYELEITVAASDIDKHVDSKLVEYGKTMKMPGFRPGKVPMTLLKQRYGRSVLGEVLESAVNDSTAKVLEDKGLRPALQPKIEVKKFDEGKDLVYTMAVEVMPEFKVMDLKGIKIERPVVKAGDKPVDEALERIAAQYKESEPVKTDRASKKGDILMIDFQGRTKKDNKEHPGMHSHDHALELGSNQFITGFEEQLIGKKKGDKVEVNVSFPTPYHSEELAGQDAIFDVEIKEIREAKAQKIDDELAKKLGLNDLKALKEAIREQIQNEYDQASRMKAKRALLDTLDDSHDFAVPQGMLDMEFQNIKQQISIEEPEKVKDGELKLSKDELEELEAIAGRRVRLGMILSEIGRNNNIQVTYQEMHRAVINEAQRYQGQEAQVFEYYNKNRQALEALRAPVYEDKVVDFIFELAQIKDKEVALDELTAEEEEGPPYKGKKKAPAKKKAGPAKKKGAEKKAAPKAAKKPAATKAKSKKSAK